MENTLTAILSEIGLSPDEIALAKRLRRAGRTDDLRRYLRQCRCSLVDEMHRAEKKVDNMDYLIRQLRGGTLT